MYLTASKKILLLSAILISTGCSLLPQAPKVIPVEIRTVEVKIPIVHPTLPRAIDLKEPYFYVVSDKNMDTFIAEMEKLNGTVVFTAMTIDDYELMAYNMQEIKRYIGQLKEVVVYYRTINTDDEPEVEEDEDL